jgi:cytochrome c5
LSITPIETVKAHTTEAAVQPTATNIEATVGAAKKITQGEEVEGSKTQLCGTRQIPGHPELAIEKEIT